MFEKQSRRAGFVAAVAAIFASGVVPGVARAAQYYYSGYDTVNGVAGTVDMPKSGPFAVANQATFYADAAGTMPYPVNTGPASVNTTEIFLGGAAGSANYTATIPNANTTINALILTANTAGTNTLEFLQSGSNRFAVSTPSPSQTFGASIQQQGSTNWIFTNPGNASAALRSNNSFAIAGAGSGNITIPFVISNVSNAVSMSVNLTGTSTLTLGGLNLFGGTTGQTFTLTKGTVDFTNGRAFGNVGNQVRLNGGTLLSSNGSTAATYSGTTATTAGGILIGGNVTFAGTTSWGLGASAVTLTDNRTITANNTGPTGTTIAGVIGDAGAAKGLTVASTTGGRLTLTGANTYTGTTVVQGGTLFLASAAQSPVLTGAGGADLQGGRLVLDYTGGTTPVAAVKSALDLAYAGNFATGQIRSTTLAAGRTIGYGDDGTSAVTVLITLPGDANLDGSVNFNDFLILQNNFGRAGTRFDQGNFNYDAATDFNDFLVLQNNFGQSVTGPSAVASREEVAALAAFAAANSPVPEPAGLAVLGVAAASVLRRRRPTR